MTSTHPCILKFLGYPSSNGAILSISVWRTAYSVKTLPRPLPATCCSWHRLRLSQLFAFFPWTEALQCPCPTHLATPITSSRSNLELLLPECAMAELRRVPGVHVYGGTAPLAPGVEKIPKQKNVIFNVDLEDSDLKDCPSFKVPFDPERAQPFSNFDEICSALKPEDDKTQCIFNSKDVHAATTGMG